MDWFLYDIGLCLERVNEHRNSSEQLLQKFQKIIKKRLRILFFDKNAEWRPGTLPNVDSTKDVFLKISQSYSLLDGRFHISFLIGCCVYFEQLHIILSELQKTLCEQLTIESYIQNALVRYKASTVSNICLMIFWRTLNFTTILFQKSLMKASSSTTTTNFGSNSLPFPLFWLHCTLYFTTLQTKNIFAFSNFLNANETLNSLRAHDRKNQAICK